MGIIYKHSKTNLSIIEQYYYLTLYEAPSYEHTVGVQQYSVTLLPEGFFELLILIGIGIALNVIIFN